MAGRECLKTVAPFAGAWIETACSMRTWHPALVAPFAGAWIETASGASPPSRCPSRPSRARGLKQLRNTVSVGHLLVAPFAGAWIETLSNRPDRLLPPRRALRGRVD